MSDQKYQNSARLENAVSYIQYFIGEKVHRKGHKACLLQTQC